MRRLLVGFALILLTCGCASPKAVAPGCSGPRRPANPYGSVLSEGATAPSASPPAGDNTPATATSCGTPS